MSVRLALPVPADADLDDDMHGGPDARTVAIREYGHRYVALNDIRPGDDCDEQTITSEAAS